MERFGEEVIRALRVSRSAIQMLVLAITQHEEGIRGKTPGFIGTMDVPDHDWVRGKE